MLRVRSPDVEGNVIASNNGWCYSKRARFLAHPDLVAKWGIASAVLLLSTAVRGQHTNTCGQPPGSAQTFVFVRELYPPVNGWLRVQLNRPLLAGSLVGLDETIRPLARPTPTRGRRSRIDTARVVLKYSSVTFSHQCSPISSCSGGVEISKLVDKTLTPDTLFRRAAAGQCSHPGILVLPNSKGPDADLQILLVPVIGGEIPMDSLVRRVPRGLVGHVCRLDAQGEVCAPGSSSQSACQVLRGATCSVGPLGRAAYRLVIADDLEVLRPVEAVVVAVPEREFRRYRAEAQAGFGAIRRLMRERIGADTPTHEISRLVVAYLVGS